MIKQDTAFDIALCLRGKALDPEHVTSVLGVEPTRSQLGGARRRTLTNHPYLTELGTWILKEQSESQDLPGLISGLVARFDHASPVFPEIDGVQEAYLDVFMAIAADDDGGGTCEFQLSQENVQALQRLALPIRFTVAVVKK